jgi:hypothetical protein
LDTLEVAGRDRWPEADSLGDVGQRLRRDKKGAVPAANRLVGAALVNFQADTSRKNGANSFPEFPLLQDRGADEASLAVPRREY